MLNRCIDELFDFRKIHDGVETAVQLTPLHPEDRAVQIDVLATGQFRMKPRSHFQQRPNIAADFTPSVGRTGNAGKDLQQRALTGSIAPDDPDNFARARGERNIFERPYGGTFALGV